MSKKEQFVVEKIMDKRMRRNKVEYLLKWEGYGDDENTWEMAASLDCPDLVTEYEKSLIKNQGKLDDKENKVNDKNYKRKASKTSQLSSTSNESSSFEIDKLELSNSNDSQDLTVETILGADRSGGELNFLIKFKDVAESQFVPAKTANLKYPQDVIRFYENCINWENKF